MSGTNATNEAEHWQSFPYEQTNQAARSLAALPGFVCLGPAPGAGAATGRSWISALPFVETAPSLSLQANFKRLRDIRRQWLGAGPACVLPVIAGILHYEAAYRLIDKLAPLTDRHGRVNDGAFTQAYPLQAGLYGWALEIDHRLQQARIGFHPNCLPETRALVFHTIAVETAEAKTACVGPFRPVQHAEDYKAAVERIRSYIKAGDCYQANLSQQFQARFQGSGWAAYLALSRLFPTPQSGFLAQGDSEVLSLSPEIFLNVRNGKAETRPIKGTRPRGRTVAEDRALASELRNSEKDRAENLMIVDLLRNDLGRLCRTGSVTVQDLFKLETYANVHHLVSTVQGELRDDVDALDVLLGCFPGGSITGAPKLRAMEIIAELEPHRRGPYCGSVFRWDGLGDLESNIAIRTLWRMGDQIRCCGGGGIVHDSDPAGEYAETLTKVRLLMDTLEQLGRQGN